ncbi:MAG: hypothetical protein HYV08_04640 [Deltaproteobacteria bacterium]|nr:hypothetical protein [Deltaproteobacteria bacterium]
MALTHAAERVRIQALEGPPRLSCTPTAALYRQISLRKRENLWQYLKGLYPHFPSLRRRWAENLLKSVGEEVRPQLDTLGLVNLDSLCVHVDPGLEGLETLIRECGQRCFQAGIGLDLLSVSMHAYEEALYPILSEAYPASCDLCEAFSTIDLLFHDITAILSQAFLEQLTNLLEERVRERTGALEATHRRLLQSERLAAIGKMSSKVAHEIRNPLSSLTLNTELLADELRNEEGMNRTEAQDLLAAIMGEVDRIARITEEYLQFARLPVAAREEVEINLLLNEVLDFVRGELTTKGIALRRELAPEVGPVRGDRRQLRQTLLNLIKNAVEAMDAGAGMLTVTSSQAGFWVEIAVADTGVGIAEKDLPHIFEPFYTTKDGGTGLGLPLTQQIITEHGGTITVTSQVGQGTRFVISLPALGGLSDEDAGDEAHG